MISLITCMDKNRGIGKNNSMPWHLPKDLKYFKEVTDGSVIIMGRKTYKSLPRMLPNREHVVISESIKWAFSSVDDALHYAKQRKKNIFVIGGATIYEQCIPYADRLYITRINAEFDCDVFFPEIDNSWHRVADSPIPIVDNGYELDFAIYERI